MQYEDLIYKSFFHLPMFSDASCLICGALIDTVRRLCCLQRSDACFSGNPSFITRSIIFPNDYLLQYAQPLRISIQKNSEKITTIQILGVFVFYVREVFDLVEYENEIDISSVSSRNTRNA